MIERHKLKSLTSIPRSAGPVLQVEESIRSEIAAISPFVDRLMLFIQRFRCVPGSEIDVAGSLREALANAVVHGNHEDPHKYVYVGCRCIPNEEVSIVVRDEGQGFGTNAVPDPTAADRIELSHGRGIYLMKALMDEVRFERGGCVVYMRKCAPSNKDTHPDPRTPF